MKQIFKSKWLICVVLMFAGAVHCRSQVAEVWTYGGIYFEEGRQIISCQDGGYAIVGTTGSDNSNNTNMYLIRLDATLNCIWNRVLGGPDVEWGYSLAEDESGNLIACGFTNEGNGNGYDVLVYKLSATGDILWRKNFGGTDWDFGSRVVRALDEGFLICGTTYSVGNGDSDGILIHINDDGELIESYTYGGSGRDEFHALLTTPENHIILAGSSEQADGITSGWILAIDDNYYTQWQTSLEVYGTGTCTDLALSDEGNFIISGKFEMEGDDENGYFEKRNFQGDFLYGLTLPDINAESIAQNDSHIYVTGTTSLFGLGGNSAVIFKLSLLGVWENGAAFGDANDEFSYDVFIDDSDNIFMLGSSKSYSTNHIEDVYLVKFADSDIVSNYTLDMNQADCFNVNVELNPALENFKVNQRPEAINFEWINGIYTVDVHDCTGRNLYHNENYSNNNQISVKSLSSGLYVVTYNDGQGHFGQLIMYL